MPATLALFAVALLQTAPTTAPAAPPAAPSSVPATRPLDEAAARLSQLKIEFYQTAWTGPALPPEVAERPVGETFRLEIVDDFVHVTPLIEFSDETRILGFTEWKGRSLVDYRSSNEAFTLFHVSVDGMDQVGAITHLFALPRQTQIARGTELLDGERNVTLIQQFDTDEPPVRLYVQEQAGKEGGEPPLTIELTASSFSELMTNHPAEVRKYLAPIFRDLGGASLVNAATPAAAWQVLGDQIPIDPAERAKLDDIIRRLDAAEFSDREAAQQELAALGPSAAAALLRAGVTNLPPEPKSSVEAFIARQRPLPPASVAVLGKDVEFVCDVLLMNDPRLNAPAAARLSTLLDLPVDPAVLAAAPDRAAAINALRPASPTTAPATTKPTTLSSP